MPKSLKCKIKHLCYNGTLTERERDRILKALEQEPREEDIHREREQAYMLGYEDASKKFRTEPCEDCISREAVRKVLSNEVFELMKLHSVNPKDNPKADAMAHGVNWSLNTLMELPPVTPKYTDEEIDKAQAVEQAYVDKMVELAVEETKRPKGKWISVDDNDSHGWGAHRCHVCSVCKDYYTQSAYEMKYCPNCGAEMGGEENA